MLWKLRDVVEELDRDNTHTFVISFILLHEEMTKRFKDELEELKARKLIV